MSWRCCVMESILTKPDLSDAKIFQGMNVFAPQRLLPQYCRFEKKTQKNTHTHICINSVIPSYNIQFPFQSSLLLLLFGQSNILSQGLNWFKVSLTSCVAFMYPEALPLLMHVKDILYCTYKQGSTIKAARWPKASVRKFQTSWRNCVCIASVLTVTWSCLYWISVMFKVPLFFPKFCRVKWGNIIHLADI